MKVSTLIGSVATLGKIDVMTLKLSTAYKVNKILAECKLAVAEFEQRRIELAKKYGTLSEDEQQYTFEDEARELFSKELEEMLDEEVDMEFKKIPAADLEDRLDISPGEIPFVEWFIDGLGD